MKKQSKENTAPLFSSLSERVVVDEIFDDGDARILRARRRADADGDDVSIRAWEQETEDFIRVWRLEAFAGFTSKQALKEGDVFFISDGSQLNDSYKPIERAKAQAKHLVMPWDTSRQMARQEIKEQFCKLTATRMAEKPGEKKILLDRVSKKFKPGGTPI